MPVWTYLSQLGDSRWLLPFALLLLLAGPRDSVPVRLRWAVALSVAGGLTLVTKLAFLGWGLGWQRLDFTGLSGHATISAAIYPVAFYLAAHGRSTKPLAWAAAGALLAALIAYSRLPLNAHSASEVISGWAVGVAASAVALSARPARYTTPLRTLALAIAAGLVIPICLPALRTHDVVMELATLLSGREQVFHRTSAGR